MLITVEGSKRMIIMLLVFIIPVTIVSGCTRQSSLKEIEDYAVRCRNLGDTGLIIEFYQVDIELREALDDLTLYNMRTTRPVRKGEEALGRGVGTLILRSSGKHPEQIVENLRRKKAIVLMIIYERGLEMPTSVE